MELSRLNEVLETARVAAQEAGQKYLDETLNGSDWDTCGFAWVNIYEYEGKKLDGRSKMGRLMKKAGVNQYYTRAFRVWNPGKIPAQSITVAEKGCDAYVEVLRENGFTAYTGSRMD